MHQLLPKKTSHDRYARLVYLLGAVLLHLIVFLMVATLVIWKAPPPPPTDEFHGVVVKIAPPPVQPPSSGAEANNPQFEPQPVIVPVVTPPSIITSVNSTFSVDASKVMDQALSHLSNQTAQGSGLTSGGGGSTGTGTAFGSSTGTSAQLTGYFFDMKQTADRQSTGVNPDKWAKILSGYINQNWDDTILNHYYKSKSPLYANTYAISTRRSEEAPKAFGLEKEVRPGLWAIHYHARVIAPQSGGVRFVGFGDNVLVVKINGTLVLDAGWTFLTNHAILHQNILPSWSTFYGTDPRALLKAGPTFHMDVAEPVDMDVLIGDDGGICAFYLLIERMGETYETQPDGSLKLPFFQLGAGTPPTFSKDEESPPHSAIPEMWQGAGD
jgi:hypothetical protein